MLKKLAIFLTVLIFPIVVNAQNVGYKKEHQRTYELMAQKVGLIQSVDQQNLKDAKDVAKDGGEKVDDVPPPPTTITPTEIAEYETDSKKLIRLNVKRQDKKERENFLRTMTWTEKNLKIRELMKNGKSYKDAKKEVENLVKVPQINVKEDSEVEKYIYDKGKFMTND